VSPAEFGGVWASASPPPFRVHLTHESNTTSTTRASFSFNFHFARGFRWTARGAVLSYVPFFFFSFQFLLSYLSAMALILLPRCSFAELAREPSFCIHRFQFGIDQTSGLCPSPMAFAQATFLHLGVSFLLVFSRLSVPH